jgi:hypothetical protein
MKEAGGIILVQDPNAAEYGSMDGARRKKEKRYSGRTDLHLLLYANFSAHELEYADAAGALMPFSTDFASLWVVTKHAPVLNLFASRPRKGEGRGRGSRH